MNKRYAGYGTRRAVYEEKEKLMKVGRLFVGWKRAELIHKRDPGRAIRMRTWLVFGWGQWGLAVMHNETERRPAPGDDHRHSLQQEQPR